MAGLNRKYRRAAKKRGLDTPLLKVAGAQLEKAVESLQHLNGSDNESGLLREIQRDLTGTYTFLKATVEDLEAVNNELALQREVLIRMFSAILGSPSGDSTFRQLEQQIRERIQNERQP